MDNIMQEIGKLQDDYRELLDKKSLTKRAMCNLVIPFRDKYKLTDFQVLSIARNELSISEISSLLIKC